MPVLPVPKFGGGLNFEANPLWIDPSQWSWSDGWMARSGCAETACAYAQVHAAGVSNLIGIVPYLAFGGFQSSAAPIARVILVTGPGGGTVLLSSGPETNTAFTLVGLSPQVTTPWYPTTAVLTLPDQTIRQVVTFGQSNTATRGLAVVKDTTFSGASYSAASPTTPLLGPVGPFAAGVASHILIGAATTIDVSDVNSVTVWDPAISNSADSITIDGYDGIQGATTFLDSAFFLRRSTVYRTTATGGIPPFTFQLNSHRGSDYQGLMFIAGTPAGVFFDGSDNFYLNDQPVNEGIYRYWQTRQQQARVTATGFPRFLWHSGYGAVVCAAGGGIGPTSAAANGFFATPAECLYYTIADGTWWRRTLPALTSDTLVASTFDHAVTPAYFGNTAVHVTITGEGRAYREQIDWFNSTSPSALPFVNGFVDTKDFAFGDPPYRSDVMWLKVDWEPLTNATTDAITIWAYTRDEFSPVTVGSRGLNIDLSSHFVQQGTLTGGASELRLRLRGKYHRFRFQQSSGMARIRGFSITYQPSEDTQHPQ